MGLDSELAHAKYAHRRGALGELRLTGPSPEEPALGTSARREISRRNFSFLDLLRGGPVHVLQMNKNSVIVGATASAQWPNRHLR